MGLSDIEQELQAKADFFEDILKKEFLPEEKGCARTVIEAMNYSLLAGGKRLRPVMMYESYGLFGSREDAFTVYPFMVAMEMIHTYSLVHDDLPAMDNDDYRRGRKTTHVVYGPGMATLAGDGLLNLAYETAVLGAIKGKKLSPYDGEETTDRYLAALRILTKKAGIYGMVGGQCADICAENSHEPDTDKEKEILSYIDENKTGALIESSLMIGALLGGADFGAVSKMEKIGSDIGIAFQIQDDILDIEGNMSELGKPTGSDIRNEKSTYVSLYGMDEAKEKVYSLTQEAITLLDEFDGDSSFLKRLFEYLIYRKK
ncbi:MAG: polyprenyl synthetase family protein [Butyrivibrio sp.]|nr:polyprenyl synthetase family protein [Butyrivibrio sp.]